MEISFGEHKQQTPVVKKNFNPTWDTQIYIPFSTPTMTNKIMMSVYDWDAIGKNDCIGTNFFKLTELKTDKIDWSIPRW